MKKQGNFLTDSLSPTADRNSLSSYHFPQTASIPGYYFPQAAFMLGFSQIAGTVIPALPAYPRMTTYQAGT